MLTTAVSVLNALPPILMIGAATLAVWMLPWSDEELDGVERDVQASSLRIRRFLSLAPASSAAGQGGGSSPFRGVRVG